MNSDDAFEWIEPEDLKDLPYIEALYDRVEQRDGQTVRVWRWHHEDLLYAEIYEDEDGKPQRESGAAITLYDQRGEVYETRHMKHGLQHREDGPCVQRRCPYGGESYTRVWAINGRHHREGDLPSFEEFTESTGELELKYEIHGKLHREGDKPAYILRENGINAFESFWIAGLCHRLHGAAVIERNPGNGALQKLEYVIWDERQPPPKNAPAVALTVDPNPTP